jgi:hypothetical protein
MADEKAKNNEEVEEKEQELDFDDLEQVAGGANPFAGIGRSDNKKLNDNVRNRV